MTETLLTEAMLCALLEENGIKLEGVSLKAALKDAHRLQEQIARLDAFLAETEAATCS